MAGLDWFYLAEKWKKWRALVNTGMNLRVPYNSWSFLIGWGTISFSRKNVFRGFS